MFSTEIYVKRGLLHFAETLRYVNLLLHILPNLWTTNLIQFPKRVLFSVCEQHIRGSPFKLTTFTLTVNKSLKISFSVYVSTRFYRIPPMYTYFHIYSINCCDVCRDMLSFLFTHHVTIIKFPLTNLLRR